MYICEVLFRLKVNIYVNFELYKCHFLYLKVHALTGLEEHWFIYILGVLIDSSQEVCFFQDTSCSQETISSAQQPSGYSEVVSTSQETSSETDASTSQGTSCPRQSDFHEVIDLSQYSTPSTPVDSLQLSGLQIYKEDVQTVHPKSMITDAIVSFLFK